MSGICEGRVAIITGAGRGIGREHALEFGRQGARVVVNDLGGDVHGEGASVTPAQEVVDEIRKRGGEAVVDGRDVSDWQAARELVQFAVDTYGGLDVVVNNAGILRDRMLANLEEDEWDAVMRVHLKGTAAMCRWAAAWWRERSKAGQANDARIINTSSGSGLFGNIGQSNYGAAKAGIAAFTIITAQELERYGVTVNALAPSARTRMSIRLAELEFGPDEFDPYDPANNAPLIAWLGSSESRGITGRVFMVSGGDITVAEGWSPGPTASKAERWDAAELGGVVPDLVARARANVDIRAGSD